MHRTGKGARRVTLWRWAALFAIGVILCGIAFGRIAGIDACGVAADPILAFEFVTNPSEVARLFPEHCRSVHVAAQYRGLLLDCLIFIPVYTAFLTFSLRALRHEARPFERRLAAAAIAMTFVAALSDEFEGVQLWRLLGALPGDQSIIDLLMPAVRIKFGLLALAVMIAGALLFRMRGWRILPGIAMIGGSALSLAGLLGEYEMVMQGSGIAWIALILTVFVSAAAKPSPHPG